jgi:hypothetical protein
MAKNEEVRIKKWVDLGEYQVMGLKRYPPLFTKSLDYLISILNEESENPRSPRKLRLSVPAEDERAIREALKGSKKYTLA